jgi:hypothetical protein
MFRKLSLVAIAAAALGAAALAPTSASAWGGFHGHRWGWGGSRVVIGGHGFHGAGYGGCYVRRAVPTPWGVQLRLVNRCY